MAQSQDKSRSESEKALLDSLIDIAIDLQRDEKQTIIKAFDDGQKHGMFDATTPLNAGAIYYNKKYIKNQPI